MIVQKNQSLHYEAVANPPTGATVQAIRYHAYESRRASPGTYVGWWNAVRTHCPKGHEYTPANTYIDPRNCRHCRECMRLANIRVRREGPMPERARERGPGKKPRVPAERLARIYAQRAAWKPREFAEAILTQTGVRYGPHHCWLLLREIARAKKAGAAL